MLLTWKEIKDAVENGHSQHKVKDSDLLTYLIVHLDTVAFGQVGQSGTVAHTNNYHTPKAGVLMEQAAKLTQTEIQTHD